jgi:hypothetical protein
MPSGGNLPIAVNTIMSIKSTQNQMLKAPRRLAGIAFGLLSKNGKSTKIT